MWNGKPAMAFLGSPLILLVKWPKKVFHCVQLLLLTFPCKHTRSSLRQLCPLDHNLPNFVLNTFVCLLFISSLLCLSQILNCSGKNSEHLLLAASKWASLCYQKQLLAFCSWLCCFVLASLQQVHLITISFSSFFPCLCLEKLKFLLVLCFLFEGLFSFP